jgi:phage tail sheath protein FI
VNETESWRPVAAAAVEAYEAGIRATTDLQRGFARAVRTEPLHSITMASADLTRDVGAVVASRARWLLDV